MAIPLQLPGDFEQVIFVFLVGSWCRTLVKDSEDFSINDFIIFETTGN